MGSLFIRKYISGYNLYIQRRAQHIIYSTNTTPANWAKVRHEAYPQLANSTWLQECQTWSIPSVGQLYMTTRMSDMRHTLSWPTLHDYKNVRHEAYPQLANSTWLQECQTWGIPSVGQLYMTTRCQTWGIHSVGQLYMTTRMSDMRHTLSWPTLHDYKNVRHEAYPQLANSTQLQECQTWGMYPQLANSTQLQECQTWGIPSVGQLYTTTRMSDMRHTLSWPTLHNYKNVRHEAYPQLANSTQLQECQTWGMYPQLANSTRLQECQTWGIPSVGQLYTTTRMSDMRHTLSWPTLHNYKNVRHEAYPQLANSTQLQECQTWGIPSVGQLYTTTRMSDMRHTLSWPTLHNYKNVKHEAYPQLANSTQLQECQTWGIPSVGQLYTTTRMSNMWHTLSWPTLHNYKNVRHEAYPQFANSTQLQECQTWGIPSVGQLYTTIRMLNMRHTLSWPTLHNYKNVRHEAYPQLANSTQLQEC